MRLCTIPTVFLLAVLLLAARSDAGRVLLQDSGYMTAINREKHSAMVRSAISGAADGSRNIGDAMTLARVPAAWQQPNLAKLTELEVAEAQNKVLQKTAGSGGPGRRLRLVA